MKCWHCNSEVIWGGDHSYEDYDIEGEGIVSNFSCSNDSCDTEVLTYYTIKKDDNTIRYRDVEDENDSL